MSDDKATIPQPDDFGWSWDDISLVLAGKTHPSSQVKALMDRLPGLHPAIIAAWLAAWREHEKSKVSGGADLWGSGSVPSEVHGTAS